MIDLNDKNAVEKLVKDCVKGDRKSQKILYETYYRKMVGVCMRYANGMDGARDIVHDGFIKVFLRLKSYEGKGSLEGWIRRIIVNTAIDTVRKNREVFFENEEDSRLAESNFEDESEAEIQAFTKLKAELVIKLIQQLAPAYKTVFNLYVIENYTHKEIGEMLGVTEGTSKSNLAKAKMRLRSLYEQNISEIDE